MARLRRLGSYLASSITKRDVIWAVVVFAIVVSFTRPKFGGRIETGRPLDVRIAGQGYFIVDHPQTGRRGFTRDGRLSINHLGQLCVGKPNVYGGWTLQPSITIPIDYQSVSITEDGIVMYSQGGSTQQQQAGQLMLAKFINPEGLREIVEGIYEETDVTGSANMSTPGQIGLGFLESGKLDATKPTWPFDPTMFVCVACCGAAMVCVRETRQIRRTLPMIPA